MKIDGFKWPNTQIKHKNVCNLPFPLLNFPETLQHEVCVSYLEAISSPVTWTRQIDHHHPNQTILPNYPSQSLKQSRDTCQTAVPLHTHFELYIAYEREDPASSTESVSELQEIPYSSFSRRPSEAGERSESRWKPWTPLRARQIRSQLEIIRKRQGEQGFEGEIQGSICFFQLERQ